jgi:hypothetical protein
LLGRAPLPPDWHPAPSFFARAPGARRPERDLVLGAQRNGAARHQRTKPEGNFWNLHAAFLRQFAA